MPSPLQRTLKFLRDDGWHVHITEKFNSFIKIRQDFGGFADCIAYAPAQKILAINAMHLSNRNDHKKFRDNPNLYVWLLSGHRFEFHQWHNVKGVERRKRWQCEVDVWTVERMSGKAVRLAGEPFTQESVSASGAQAGASPAKGHSAGRTRVGVRRRADTRGATANRKDHRRRLANAHKLGATDHP